jgi:undecaprenyl-diphosphatase
VSIQGRIGFTLVGLAGFAALASQSRGNSILYGDVRLARWVQGRDWPLLDPLTNSANWSMRTGPLTAACAIILAALTVRRLWIDAGFFLAANVFMHLSNVFKEVFESPRPTPNLVRVTEHATDYGFPGGRAGNAVLFLGAIAWIASRRIDSVATRSLTWVVAGAWILLTGLARVRVGAHWPSDIYGAWFWTVPALVGLTALVQRSTRRKRNVPRKWPMR